MSEAINLGPVRPSDIERLEPMSESVTRLAQMVGDPDTDLGAIIRIVELDQALTASVLRWANSVWSLSQIPILTVRDAVIRLGAGNVLKLAVGKRISGDMSRSFPGYGLGEKELWRHSIASALAVENLAQFAQESIPGVGFTAALLHDIGKLLLEPHFTPEIIAEIKAVIERERVTYVEAELRVLGTDHAKVGGAVGRHWKFPELLVQAIENHHDPDAAPNPVQDAVHIANTVAKIIGVGLGNSEMNMRVSEDAARRLGLASSGLESLCALVQMELAKAESMWEVR